MTGARVEVDAPRRVTLGDPITFSIAVHNDGSGASDRHAVRVHGPFLPWDGVWLGRSPRIAELPRGDVARVSPRGAASARGEHHLDSFSATVLAPLGLSQGRPVYGGVVKASWSSGRLPCVVRPATPPRVALPAWGRRGLASRRSGEADGPARRASLAGPATRCA